MRRALAALLLALPVAVAGCGGGAAVPQPPPPGAAAVVDLHNVAFSPKVVTVRAGQTVAWKFDDGSIAHNVTGPDWKSGDRTSGYYTRTFSSPGTFAYVCTIHSNMNGQVTVKP